MDDVDFSTHKLLKSDMEAVKKLKKEPYDDFSLDKWNLDGDVAKNNLETCGHSGWRCSMPISPGSVGS